MFATFYFVTMLPLRMLSMIVSGLPYHNACYQDRVAIVVLQNDSGHPYTSHTWTSGCWNSVLQ